MPGTYAIDPQATFSAVLLMACSPRRKYGTDEQDTNAAGVPKWSADCAVTFSSVNGGQTISEVISVTIAAAHDPAAGINPGTPVILDGLRLGVSGAEKTENGRIRGGKPYFSAEAVRAAHAQRQSARDAA